MRKIKSVLASVMTMLTVLPMTVMADVDGTLTGLFSTTEGTQLMNTLKPILSTIVNVIFFGYTVILAVKGFINLVKMQQTTNTNEKATLKEAVVSNFVGAAIAFGATMGINLVLRVVGLGGIFSFTV